MLFYAFLSEEIQINSLSDIINSYDNKQWITHHLGLDKNALDAFAQELK